MSIGSATYNRPLVRTTREGIYVSDGAAGTALVFVVAVSGSIGVAQVRTTQTTDATAEGAARETLEAFITEWNTAEDANVRQVLNFPFVSVLGVDAPVIDPSPEDFSQGFDQLRDREGWSHSSFDFDSFTVVKSSPDKVHAEIDFSRYRADGTAYLNSRVFYILTKRDDHWGIQLRTRAGFRSDLEERERAEIVAAARQAVLDFLTAFNAGDADRTVEVLNHPHIFMTAGGGFGVAEDVVDGPRPDFDGMRQREDWHMSTIDALEASIVTRNKVHFELTFTRWHPNGTRYWTVLALWIVTRVEDHWGIQVRSLMPATFDAMP